MNQKIENKYYTFDFWRILFCFGVVIGHIYCNFFQKSYQNLYGTEWTQIHNICTDGFFILSGIFMAMTIEKKRLIMDSFTIFKSYTLGRIKKLYLPCIFMEICIGIFTLASKQTSFYTLSEFWHSLLLINLNATFSLNDVTWYISALFWTGLIISFLLSYYPNLSKFLFLPIVIFIGYTFMFSKYSCNNLGGFPLVANFWSAGILRAFCVMSIGIQIYYFSAYIKTNFIILENRFKHCFIFVLELLATLGLIYMTIQHGLNKKSFLIYPCFGLLCIIFLLREENLFRICNKKNIKRSINFLSKYTLSIYLTHAQFFQNLNYFYPQISRIKPVYVFMGGGISALLLGILFYHIEKQFELLCKKIISLLIKSK